MNYGFLDVEMTYDGKHEGGKFVDDGRKERSGIKQPFCPRMRGLNRYYRR